VRRHGSHLVGTAQTTSRIEALADGVFAIVLTLMVFEIRVADADVPLPRALALLWPNFFAYAVSFVQLGIYWAGHRNQFAFIEREDHTLRWINLLFLALVSLIPFSAQLIGNHLTEPLALGIYAGNMIAVGLVLSWHWVYANRLHLVADDLPPGVLSTGIRRTLTAPVLYAVALPITIWSPVSALVLFALVPLFYLFPALIDRLWVVRR